jgi:hypothetical protein
MCAKDWRLDIPDELDAIADLCVSGLLHRAHYVYYLYRDGEVVYIGQTSNVMSRMVSHSVGKSRKHFDGAMYRLCESENDMRKIESNEIHRLRPAFNRRRGLSYSQTQEEWLDSHPSYVLAAAIANARMERGTNGR